MKPVEKAKAFFGPQTTFIMSAVVTPISCRSGVCTLGIVQRGQT